MKNVNNYQKNDSFSLLVTKQANYYYIGLLTTRNNTEAL